MTLNSNPRQGEATEDYLKAIFKLEEACEPVSTSRLAELLGVSPAAVTKALRQLSRKKLAHYTPYHGVSLSESGRKTALEIIRHHRLLETFLHEVMGFGWDEVDAEAERLEHHISEAFEARMDALLNYPKFDPHGAPIPSPEGELTMVRGEPLASVEGDGPLTVAWVSDKDASLLQFLDEIGLRPGVEVEVADRQPLKGPITIVVDGVKHAVGHEVADRVFVDMA